MIFGAACMTFCVGYLLFLNSSTSEANTKHASLRTSDSEYPDRTNPARTRWDN